MYEFIKKYSVYVVLTIIFVSGLASKIFIAFRHPLNSDNVQPALIFQDIVVHHNYLLKNWYLVPNSYLFTDFPVYLILGMTLGMSSFTIKLGACLLFVAGVFLFGLILLRLFGRTVAVAGLAAMVSIPIYPSTLLLQTYNRMGTLTLVLLITLLIISVVRKDREGAACNVCHILIFSLLAAAVFSDPYVIFVLLGPLLLSYLILRTSGTRMLSGKTELLFLVTLPTSAIAGLALQYVTSYWGLHIITFADLVRKKSEVHGSALLSSFRQVFDMGLPFGKPISFESVVQSANLALFVMLGVGAAVIIKREKDALRRLIVLLFFVMIFILSISFIGKEKFADAAVPRYLLPLVFGFSMFWSLAVFGGYFRSVRFKALVLALFLISASSNIHNGFMYSPPKPHDGLPEFLQKNNLTYGYSNYLNSNIVTFLTEGKVKVRSVLAFRDVFIRPLHFVSKSDWYRPSLYEGPTFLMVSREEGFDTIYAFPKLVEDTFGKPERKLEFNGFRIYVWPFNIMSRLMSVEISGRSLHLTGSFEPSPEGGFMRAARGQEGALLYGKLWSLPVGEYEAIFDVWVDGEPGQVAAIIDVSQLDIVKKEYTPKVQSTSVIAGAVPRWEKHVIRFEVLKADKNLSYECRVFAAGAGEVRVRAITMERI